MRPRTLTGRIRHIVPSYIFDGSLCTLVHQSSGSLKFEYLVTYPASPLASILSVAVFHDSRYAGSQRPFQFWFAHMNDEHTTAVVQLFLDELAGDGPSDSAVRSLLDRSVRRLHQLCAAMLYRSYPRLTQPPMNLRTEEMLGAVVERLLKALREVQPRTVREFFGLASQHMRWELNEMARRLDERSAHAVLDDGLATAPASTDSGLTPDALRMLSAIDNLPAGEREAFDLVRIQGLTQAEAAEVLGVSAATVNRRLNRGLQLLLEALSDLRPDDRRGAPD